MPQMPRRLVRAFPAAPARAASTWRLGRTKGSPYPFAFAFDIDGVFYKGSEDFPAAIPAVTRLRELGVPFVFVTNGGGHTEYERAVKLTNRLGVQISEDEVQLTHTPLRHVAEDLGDGRLFAVGPTETVRPLAESCGFRNVVTSEELWKQHPMLWPDMRPCDSIEHVDIPELHDLKFDAMAVFYPADNWYRDLQIAVDVAKGRGRIAEGAHLEDHSDVDFPIFAAGPDLEYAAEWHAPRFGSGAFISCFQHLLAETSSTAPAVQVCGKPHGMTYAYAEDLLMHKMQDAESLQRIYMVGDNPETDIMGANLAGDKWRSVLVHTGMFQPASHGGADNHHIYPADYVAKDVLDAVEQVLSLEGVAGSHEGVAYH